MVLYGKGRRMAARREAASAQRKYVTRFSRKPYRTRRKTITITKTPAEKKLISEQRAERRQKMAEALAAARETVAEEARKMQAEFGLHSDKYFEQQIFQHARVTSTKRKTNPWNAFLRNELQIRNDALPAGAPRYSSSDKTVISEISAKWKSMSDEEKASVTEDLVKDLDEQKEMRALAVQSVPISAFHDVRSTLESVFEELRRLHARTGIEIGLFAVRSGRHQFTPPMIFATSAHVHDFFQISLSTPMDDVACSLEAYCLSGVSGLVQRSVDVIQDLRSRLTAVINQKLGQVTQYTAKKMVYVGFAEHITARHGVVIENWPLPRFLAPSAIRTCLELTTLLSAWETDTTRFRKLSREEWQEWQERETTGITASGIRPVSLASFVRRETSDSDAASATAHPSASGSHGRTAEDDEDVELYIPPAKPRKQRSDYGKSHQQQKDAVTSRPATSPSETSSSGAATSSSGAGTSSSGTGTSSSGAGTSSSSVAIACRDAQSDAHEHGPAMGSEGRENVPAPSSTNGGNSAAVHHLPHHPPPILSSIPPIDTFALFQADGAAYIQGSESQVFAMPNTAADGPQALPATAVTAFGSATFMFPPSHNQYPTGNPPPSSTGPLQHQWHNPPTFAIDPALLDSALTHSPPISNPSSCSPAMGPSTVAGPPPTATSGTPDMATPSVSFQFIEYTGGHNGSSGRGRGGRNKRART